jgi:hypothetical protein
MRVRHSFAALLVATACAVVALVPAPPIGAAGDPVAAYLDSIRDEPQASSRERISGKDRTTSGPARPAERS